MKRLLSYALEEGYGDSAGVDADWGSFALRLITGDLGKDAFASTDATLTDFFATKTKSQMIAAALERRLLLAPVLGLDEIIESDQLRERQYPIEVHHPGVGRSAKEEPMIPLLNLKRTRLRVRNLIRNGSFPLHEAHLAQ